MKYKLFQPSLRFWFELEFEIMLQIECCERRIGLSGLLNRPNYEDCDSEWRKARLASVPYYRGALRGNLAKFAGSCVVLRKSQSFD